MKNLIIILALTIVLGFLAFITISCNQNNPVGEGYTILDSGRIGFIRPSGSVELSGILEEMKALNHNVITVFKADSTNSHSSMISVARYVADSVTPMEIAFIEDFVKYQGISYGCRSKLVDFGVYDKGDKRFRYKVVNIDRNCLSQALDQSGSSDDQDTASSSAPSDIYRILYYFMKNDNDSVIYELSIASNLSELE